MSVSTPKQVRCPQCGKTSLWTPDNPWRPFCSERCKQIDLGAWASETYRVPDRTTPVDGAGAAGDAGDSG